MNGYSNHATWNANMWYGDQIADYVEQYQAHFAEISISEMADDLESFCYELSGLNELPIGFVRDAAMQEWSKIDWRAWAGVIRMAQPAMEDCE